MITREHATEYEVHHFSTFASDLYDAVPEMRHGFPAVIPTNLGNGQPFIGFKKKLDYDGDLMYVRYRQQLGCINLIVYND